MTDHNGEGSTAGCFVIATPAIATIPVLLLILWKKVRNYG